MTLSEGLLLRWLDDELDAEEARRVREHLTTCAGCRSDVDRLRERARRVRQALLAADPASPGPRAWRPVRASIEAGAPGAGRAARARPLLAAGVALALLATGVLATSASARDWVAERWSRLVAPAPEVHEALDPDPGRASVSFQPTGPRLEIILASAQSAGALDLRFGAGQEASVSVTGGSAEHLVVGGAVLRVENPPEAGTSYDVTLPEPVEEVSVRVGDLEPRTMTRAEAGAGGVRVDLATGEVVRIRAPRDEP